MQRGRKRSGEEILPLETGKEQIEIVPVLFGVRV